MDPAFAEWSKAFVLLCHVTTGIDTDPRQDLLEEKGGQGFPHLAFLDTDGGVLAVHEGGRSVEGFRQTGSRVLAYLELRKRDAAGEKGASLEFLIAQMEMGQGRLEEVQKRLKAAGALTAEQQARVSPLLANLEVRDALQKEEARQKQGRLEMGGKFLAMLKAGRVPTGDTELQAFCGMVLEYAEGQRDAEGFSGALELMRAKYGDNPNAARYFEAQERRLLKIKEAKP